ncbi:MAG: YceI family protein [Proteobacteria bacterium]|nr:YceI family protein [Pseudomonadota bacterium]MBS0572767.1 YceI family protein [Pseudomonadota bacterium]
MIRTFAGAILGALIVGGAAAARPLHYTLDPDRSVVGFEVHMGQTPLKGRMPVTRADLALDFDRAAASKVTVALDPAAAEMGLPFATDAMRGALVLDAAHYPQIGFVSTRVRATDGGAWIDGRITIRGVTRPIRLLAQFYRPQGSPEGTRGDLTIRLTGSVSRAAFGAAGYGDLVGDQVDLDILAHIHTDEAK